MASVKNKERILLIVESPNKVKTLKQFLPDNYIVMASVGHITKINDSGLYNMGIDPKNDFKIDFIVSPDKKDVVSKLKDQVKVADTVYLCSDPDREGEAISWHLKNVLKIPESKYKRVTYHEVTKSAVLKALENPRKIDDDLVDAAIARSAVDKIIGYRLSGIARNNVGARSVGRCQSAGLKLIVEREEEIQNFKPEKYFDIYLKFSKNKVDFKAKYLGTDKKQVKNLKSLEECKKVSEDCKLHSYDILDIENKDSLENPKPPFITSSYQQEVCKKLGISVKYAMDCAQKLFEGIDLNGRHQALITYHRTDFPDLSPEFQDQAKEYVLDNFGKDYYNSFKAPKKEEGEQAGHEGIRCVDVYMTPDRLKNYINDERLLKIYTIIWRRSVACLMKPAIIGNTIYTIENGNHRFGMTSRELKFDGYRKVYNYGVDDDSSEDDQLIKETFSKAEELKDTYLEAIAKETQPPKRFNEASFIKELDKRGIGRPSTYATILGILLDDKRGYTKVEDKFIVPTELGIKLSHFLDDKFSNVISVPYTAELEKELDLIANKKKGYVEFLTNFYNNLEDSIKKVDPNAQKDGEVRICPECGKPLVRRFSPKTKKYFYGCSGYPNCKHLEN